MFVIPILHLLLSLYRNNVFLFWLSKMHSGIAAHFQGIATWGKKMTKAMLTSVGLW
jgi:hypothetical protein